MLPRRRSGACMLPRRRSGTRRTRDLGLHDATGSPGDGRAWRCRRTRRRAVEAYSAPRGRLDGCDVAIRRAHARPPTKWRRGGAGGIVRASVPIPIGDAALTAPHCQRLDTLAAERRCAHAPVAAQRPGLNGGAEGANAVASSQRSALGAAVVRVGPEPDLLFPLLRSFTFMCVVSPTVTTAGGRGAALARCVSTSYINRFTASRVSLSRSS